MDELIYKETAKNALRDEFKRAPTNAIRAMKVIEALPSAQPIILYGYNIEHLVYIANVMQKENITPKEVVDRLRDARLIAEALVEKMEERLMQIMGEQYE